MKRYQCFCFVFLAIVGGCRRSSQPDLVFGKRGVQDGEFSRPRAITIDPQGRIYVVDFTARIQVFNTDGTHRGHTWTTPDFRNGRPSGLSLDNRGRLIVSDSHYHCIRIYSPEGEELASYGGIGGKEPGQFGYISDCLQDDDGNFYVSEFGSNDRITKLDPQGKFLACWGVNGDGPLQFRRTRAMAFGPDGLIYVADACNHRVQVITKDGKFVREFGGSGSEPGQMNLPYDLAFSPDGHIYVAERGNHRVQKFTKEGTFVATWGKPGREPGHLADPWAVAVDKDGYVYVVDTENHRIQKVKF